MKVLGEKDTEELNETTMDINQRILRKITVGDLADADAAFSKIMGEEVALIDSGRETAVGIKMTLEKLGLLNERTSGGCAEYFVTNNTDAFDNVAKVFLGEDAHIKSILKGIEE